MVIYGGYVVCGDLLRTEYGRLWRRHGHLWKIGHGHVWTIGHGHP